MNWKLLLPSTWDPLSAFHNLLSDQSQVSTRALSDVFILTTILVAIIFVLMISWQTVKFYRKKGKYFHPLKKAADGQQVVVSSNLQLFRELQNHLINLPDRDGSDRTSWRRTVDAAEIFRDSILTPDCTRSRLFLSVPGILTGIGVLGTFVGLQMGIGGLDLQDLKNLETSIVPLIQGCAVAFSTSVWGVLTSLVFSVFEKWLEGIAHRRIHKLQNLIDGLIPRYVPEEAMAELERSSRGTEEILKGLAVAIGDQMQQAIGRLGEEIKDAVANATSEGQGPLMEKSAELLSRALTAEIGNLKEQIGSMSTQFSSQFTGVSGKLLESVESFEPTVKILSDTVGNAQRTVMEAVDKLNAHATVMERMATAATEIRQTAEAFSSMKETLQLSSARNEEAAKAQLSSADTNERVAQRFAHIGERLPEIQQTLEDAARVISSIAGPIGELKTYLERLPDDQRENEEKRSISENERNQLLLTMSSDLAGKVSRAAEQFAKVGDMADKLGVAAKSLDDASNELATFGNHVRDASKEQRSAADAARAAALSGEKTATFLEPLPQAFKELTDGLRVAGEHVKTGAEAACKSYREANSLQKQWILGAEAGLKAMRDRLQEIINAYGNQIEGQTKNLMNKWTTEVAACLQTYQGQVEQLQNDMDALQETFSQSGTRHA